MAEKKQQRAKKLNQNNLKKIEKQQFPVKKIQVEAEGEKFNVEIQEVFKPSSIEACIRYISEVQHEADNNEVDIDVVSLGLLSIIKNFTDIEFTDNILQDLDMFILMTNLGITDQIFNELNQDELDKLGSKVEKMSEQLPNALEMFNNFMVSNGDGKDGESGSTVKAN